MAEKIKTKKNRLPQARAGKGWRMLITPNRFCSSKFESLSLGRIMQVVIPECAPGIQIRYRGYGIRACPLRARPATTSLNFADQRR
ncbi:MAG: hypothetical protein WCA28_34195 [Bradyrhizobium sp.]